MGKMRSSKKFVGSFEASRQPTRWLELVTADHLVSHNGSMEGIAGDCDAFVAKDLYSKVKTIFPVFSKSSDETEMSLRRFFGNTKVDILCPDNAPELKLACKRLGIINDVST